MRHSIAWMQEGNFHAEYILIRNVLGQTQTHTHTHIDYRACVGDDGGGSAAITIAMIATAKTTRFGISIFDIK